MSDEERARLDRELREALGFKYVPGTLALLGDKLVCWSFDDRANGGGLIEWCWHTGNVLGAAGVTGWYASVPELAKVTEPDEALVILHAAACG